MTDAADLPQELIDQVRALTPAQKAALRLELEPAGDPELKALLTQRWEDYKSGKTQAIPLDDHLTELDRLIAERRSQ